jgi:putative oxidoreductase
MILIQAIASLALRFALALPFWKSGLTRWDGPLEISQSTLTQFQYLFKPTIFGTTYDMPYPVIAGWGAAFAEVLLPAALVIGFATRLSALGLLVMTFVIFSVYSSLGVDPGQWQTETLPWAALALGLIAYGPGAISFDYFIREAWKNR